MLRKSFDQFLRDDRGSYTIWSLIWFMMYVAIGGLAVDLTDAYRNQSLLQSTADAAALAGAMSLPDTDEVVPMARLYAQTNMGQDTHGVVLKSEDVVIGTWNLDSETFTPGGTPPNAVYVTTRRAEQNSNPLAMNLLRILALIGIDPWFNIQAEAVAVQGLELCLNNGIIAGGKLTMTTHQGFYNRICLHGVKGMKLTNANFFELGVGASVGCAEGQANCLMPNESNAMSNEGFPLAWQLGGGYEELRQPENAQRIGAYIDNVIDLATNPDYTTFEDFVTAHSTEDVDYQAWQYLSENGDPPAYYSGAALPADALSPLGTTDPAGSYTVYHIQCDPTSSFALPSGTYRNMAIVSTCPISMASSTSVDMAHVMIAVDWWQGANPTTQFGMHFAGNATLGATACGDGGVQLMTRNSSAHFAASGQINNSRLLSGWNIHLAAGGAGEIGLHMEAINDISLTQGGKFGLCPIPADEHPQVWRYALVR